MALTAGAVADKMSELRSKIRAFEYFLEQIDANYLPSDAGAAELKLARDDGAVVVPKHWESVKLDISERVSTYQEELEQIESLVFRLDDDDNDEEEAEEEQEPAVEKKPVASVAARKDDNGIKRAHKGKPAR